MTRESISPITETIGDERQKLARHYGVHPYFTRRSAAVVRAYIERYSSVDDTVADPYGGSGVTAIEALLLGRRAIHNDLNPFANFLTTAIADTRLPSIADLWAAFQQVADACESEVRAIEKEDDAAATRRWSRLPLPENIALPRTSDAKHFYDLFTPRQLAALATIRKAVDGLRDGPARDSLLLAWSASVAKLNRTFLSTKGRAASRGGSSIFSLYRYKLAKEPVELPLWDTFRGRVENVVAAKAEVLSLRDYAAGRGDAAPLDSARNLRVMALDAAALDRDLPQESVDYIFTDPPYGGYISYLDLSILWNHWLGFPVSESCRAQEAIVGGEMKLTEDHYRRKLADGLACCVRLLRPDRWLSVVFQHWDTRYFETILDTLTEAGCQFRAAVTQEREVIWSMHKKKNAETMLAGEMILTFYKPGRRPRHAGLVCESQPVLFDDLLDTVLTECSVDAVVTSQYIFNRIVVLAWQRQALAELKVTREAFAAALRDRGWRYDPRGHLWRRAESTHPDLLSMP